MGTLVLTLKVQPQTQRKINTNPPEIIKPTQCFFSLLFPFFSFFPFFPSSSFLSFSFFSGGLKFYQLAVLPPVTSPVTKFHKNTPPTWFFALNPFPTLVFTKKMNEKCSNEPFTARFYFLKIPQIFTKTHEKYSKTTLTKCTTLLHTLFNNKQ